MRGRSGGIEHMPNIAFVNLKRSKWFFGLYLCLIVLLTTISVFGSICIAAPLSENPLEPFSTSSPRASLHSFLKNMDSAYAEFQRTGHRTNSARKYIDQAVKTLDLSQIPPFSRDDEGFAAGRRRR